MSVSGKVYLVGAGPGDPGLITLRGVECLKKADLVFYDYLVNTAILEYAPRAEKVCYRQRGEGRKVSQDEINARLIEAARQGKTVVRLKGGDPDVFGHSAEETTALTAAGIPYEIVPGVTAALAAAGYVEIPVTHGERASAVALVTGQQRPDKSDPLDYAVLADFPGTLVFYMGVLSAGRWSKALMERGKSAATPVCIVRRCTWPDQEIVRCTLGTVAQVIEERRLRPPAVIVVGEVVNLAPVKAWFAARPLAGQTVLAIRPRLESDALSDQLRELGANVIEHPVIRISDPADWRPVDAALERLDEFDWIVFHSANGVRYFISRLMTIGGDLRRLGLVKLAAIGPATAEELLRHNLRADVVPPEFCAESLAETLAGEASGKKFLLIRASRGREVLAKQLTAVGATAEHLVVYTSSDVEQPNPQIVEMLEAGLIDWIPITSSSIARSLVNLFGDKIRQCKLASISPITTAVLRELGYEAAVEAAEFTMPGLATAILQAVE